MREIPLPNKTGNLFTVYYKLVNLNSIMESVLVMQSGKSLFQVNHNIL